MARDYLLYSDFNCPFCYALHERLHELQLLHRCAWRGVQHAPHLPRPMKAWEGSLGAELRHEVAVVQRLAPGIPIALPSGKPNTGPAIKRAGQLLRQSSLQGMELVRRTYRAFWCDGEDISDPVVLSRLAEGLGGGEAGDESRRMVQEWDAAWHETGQAGVPLVVSPGGVLLVGCVPIEQIQAFFTLED